MTDLSRPLGATLACLAVASCSPSPVVRSPTSHGLAASAQVIEPIAGCTGMPAALAGVGVYAISQVYFGPARPQPGDAIYFAVRQYNEPNLTTPTASVSYTIGSGVPQTVALTTWCAQEESTVQIVGGSLGTFPAGTTIHATVNFSDGSALTNGGAGYTLEVGDAPDLTWVGGTQTAYAIAEGGPAGTPDTLIDVPPAFVVGGNDLTLHTDTYPERAAASLTLFWANADYSTVSSAPMTLIGDGEGTYGDNDRFSGVIPAAALAGGQAAHYWVQAIGANGQILYDSQGGANYTLVPRPLSVGWAGNLGAYDAQGGPNYYENGQLFNADLSTTVGCAENGPDDYWVQAVQVYVPGLTDQGYQGDLATAATTLIQAQLWTNLQPSGWGPESTTCSAGVGNNFVCGLPFTVFPEGNGCLPNGNVPAGQYQYKVRFSVDQGNTWYWVGSTDGSGGGNNLNVYYGPTCAFAGNSLASCTADAG